MSNQLSLAARYRNAKAEYLPFHKWSPALRCMALIAEYRDLREYLSSDDDLTVAWAEGGMEQLDREFAAARAKLRAEARFNQAMEAA